MEPLEPDALFEDVKAADLVAPEKPARRFSIDRIKSVEVGRRLRPDGTREEYFRADLD